MKTRLWATITANGSYARATPEQPPRHEALADFAAQVAETNNFILGRVTYEGWQAGSASDADPPFGDADVIVVSSQPIATPGATRVASPHAALEHLAARGRSVALVAGGEALHDAFLAADLVDELVLVIAPVLASKDLQLALPRGFRELVLVESRPLGSGLIRLHYAVRR